MFLPLLADSKLNKPLSTSGGLTNQTFLIFFLLKSFSINLSNF